MSFWIYEYRSGLRTVTIHHGGPLLCVRLGGCIAEARLRGR